MLGALTTRLCAVHMVVLVSGSRDGGGAPSCAVVLNVSTVWWRATKCKPSDEAAAAATGTGARIHLCIYGNKSVYSTKLRIHNVARINCGGIFGKPHN